MTAPVGNWDHYAPAAPSKSSTSSSSNPNDIWGLGKLYGDPVLVGTTTEGGPTTPGTGPMQAELGAGGETTDADQFASTQKLMKQATKMWQDDPAQYRALQQQLAAAGYYGQAGKYVPGRLDSTTRTALVSALKDYTVAASSGAPITISEFLGQQAAATSAAATAKPKPQVQLTDPTQIRAAAQAAFETALGRSATAKELNAFVSQFQTTQQQAETTTNASVTPPDLSSDAMAFAQQSSPAEYGQHNAESLKGALLNLFLPSESQLPTSTPVPKA